MRSSQKIVEIATEKNQFIASNDEHLTSFDKAMLNLQNYLEEIKHNKLKKTFAEHEQVIHRLTQAIGQESMKEALECYDIENTTINVEGEKYRKKDKAPHTYQTAQGPVKVERYIYAHATEKGKSICPMELQTGIIESYWSPMAAKNAMWSLTHLTPQDLEELCMRWGGMNPSKSSLDRLPKALQKHWEPQTIEHHQTLSMDEKIPAEAVCLAVSLDGVMIGMKNLQENSHGTIWQEASCGTVSLFDKEGERLCTYYYGRMPESKKITLKTQLKNHVEIILKKRPDLVCIAVADGAQDNWTFFEEEMPQAIAVTDFFHACEYVKKGCEAAFPEPNECKKEYEKRRVLLLEDVKGIDKIIRSFRYFRDKDRKNAAFQTVITYLSNNKERMRYALQREKNYPIGSGVVEAACKSLVNQRMKRSGMSWQTAGGQSILTFRSLVKSHRFDKAWSKVAAHYQKNIVLQSNVVSLKKTS